MSIAGELINRCQYTYQRKKEWINFTNILDKKDDVAVWKRLYKDLGIQSNTIYKLGIYRKTITKFMTVLNTNVKINVIFKGVLCTGNKCKFVLAKYFCEFSGRYMGT